MGSIVQLELPFDPPTSAPLRIPDGQGGQLWLKMGSLKDGCPIYEEDEGLSAGFVDLTQDQDAVWARAEAYHREKNGRAA